LNTELFHFTKEAESCRIAPWVSLLIFTQGGTKEITSVDIWTLLIPNTWERDVPTFSEMKDKTHLIRQ
jgi:hypothetical protein